MEKVVKSKTLSAKNCIVMQARRNLIQAVSRRTNMDCEYCNHHCRSTDIIKMIFLF